MVRRTHYLLEHMHTTGGGGPEAEAGSQSSSRATGLLTLAFGFALGISLMLLLFLVQTFIDPGMRLHQFVIAAGITYTQAFLAGFIGGSVTAGTYNYLLLRQFNIFGI